MDGGSTPPRSTKLKVDESQQNQAIALRNKGCSFFRSETPLVSVSPDRAGKWHSFDTFLPSKLNGIGTRECHSYRQKIFNRHPYLADALANQYLRIYQEKSLYEANLFIGRIDKKLILHDFNLSSSHTEVKSFCKESAHKCRLIIVEYGENETAYNICRAFAYKYSIEIPTFDSNEPHIPTLNRLSCSDWWYSNINKIRLQHV
ncbi:MAG: hypothetical protein QF552_01810, partial [Litorilituus sp.]|nr:hypothetical protein [Litorilituus sp.]